MLKNTRCHSFVPCLIAALAMGLSLQACEGQQLAGPATESDGGTSSIEQPLIIVAPQTVRVPMNADTTVRSYLANTPGNTSRDLYVGRSLLDWTRSMVRVDTVAIQNMLGASGTLVAAKLQLTITASIDGSLNGTQVGAHRVTKAWTEPGATWNCSNDSVPTNLWNDCTAANGWVMGGAAGSGPYVTTPTGTTQVSTGLSGTMELDVTADVRAFLGGTATNHGWLLRVQNDPIASAIVLSSREGASPPQLVLTFVGPCDPTSGGCGQVVSWEGANGTELPILEDPLTPAQTFAAAEAFTWAGTSPVPELTAEGDPTLRYATIYIESRSQKENLDAYEIDWNMLPLFRDERAKWQGKTGHFAFTGDGRGVFVFAVIPGRVYNLLRRYALDHPTEQPYRAIILRAPPASMPTNPDGSLQYRALSEQGYLYRGIGIDQATAGLGMQTQALFGEILREAVTPIVEVARDTVDLARRGIGKVARLLKGEAALNLSFYPRVADPAFKKNDLIRRGWGKDRGQPIPIKGVPIRVSQGKAGFQLQVGSTNDKGFVRAIVTKESPTDVCFEQDNYGSIITSLLAPMQTCQFSIPESEVKGEVTRQVFINSRYVQGFTQFMDGADFMRDVNGYTMRQTRVLVGDIAEAVGYISKEGGGGGAFAPCMDFPNWKFGAMFDAMHAAAAAAPALSGVPPGIPGLLAAGKLFTADFLSPDIVMPASALQSRGTATHEYGHVVMCNTIFDEGIIEFGQAYTDVMVGGLTGEDPDNEQRVVAEAWADFFAAQVVGGVNYFYVYGRPPPFGATQPTTKPIRSLNIDYCDPLEKQCMDNNVGGIPFDPSSALFGERDLNLTTFALNIARIATTMHDVFDGTGGGPTLANIPGNGAAWFNDVPIDGDRTLLAGPSVWGAAHQRDEFIALPMDLADLMHRWMNVGFNGKHRLKKASLEYALTDYMKARGVSDLDICNLFALHSRTNTCPAYLPVAKNVKPTPVVLTGYVFGATPGVPDEQGRNAHWEWTADAPYASGFNYVLKNGVTGAQITSGPKGYERGNPVVFEYLNAAFNTDLALTVTVVNDTLTSKAVTHHLVTSAQPVATPTIALFPGRSTLCWNETVASNYGIELSIQGSAFANKRTLPDTNTTNSCTTFFGLDSVPHALRVVAINRQGVEAAASPEVTFTPMPPKEVFVSVTAGNDSTATGTKTRPFKSINAALAFIAARRAVTNPVVICDPPPSGACRTEQIRSTDFDYSALRIAQGTYNATAFSIAGSAFTTAFSGGLAEGTFARQANRRSALVMTTGPGPIRGCGAGTVVWPSAVAVKDGAMFLEAVDLSAPATNLGGVLEGQAQPCQTVVGARTARALNITNSSIAFSSLAGAGGCQIGLTVDGSAAQSVDTLDLVDTTITAASLPTSRNLTGILIGMCAGGMEQIRINSQTDITATDAPQRSTATGAVVLASAVIDSAENVAISRSFFSLVDRAPEWHTTGSQVALNITKTKTISIDNSVLRTATGGSTNHALAINSLAGGSVRIAQVTALTGADWAATTTGPSAANGAAVATLAGATDYMMIVNSIFAYGAGSHADRTGIDRSGVTANPGSALVAGNLYAVFSPVPYTPSIKVSPVRCRQAAGAYANNLDFDEPSFHGCAGTLGDPQAYDVYSNQWLLYAPCGTFPLSAPGGGETVFTCQSSLASHHANNTMTEHSLDGEPSPLNDARIACYGIAMRGKTSQKNFSTDIFGTLRRQNRPGVDDNCDMKGRIDEAGEVSGLNSVGAFDSACSCSARRPVIF